MAIEGFTPLDFGGCVDQDFFPPAFDSLAALEQAAKDGASEIECVHLSGSASGNSESGETCVMAIAPTDMPDELLNGDQVCCLILSVSGAMLDPIINVASGTIPNNTYLVYYPNSGINFSIKCSGQTISTSEGRGSGLITAIIDPASCDFTSGIEICVEAYSDAARALPFTISWCGCLFCVQKPPLPLENYYIPREHNPECEYGMGDLAQVIHVINQMNAAFRCAGYEVECITRDSVEFDTQITTVEEDAKWIGIACTRVNWPIAPAGAAIKANVTMGCSGRPINCNSSLFRIRVSNAGGAEFVSVGCGECQKGEQLWFGAAPEISCTENADEDQSPIIDVEGASDMVFFVFKKISTDLPNIPQLSSGCVFDDNTSSITDAANDIHEAACKIKDINKQSIPFTGGALTGDHLEIIPAHDDPEIPNPEPDKKWVILGSARAQVALSVDLPGSNYEDLLTGEFNYQVKCGGQIVHTSPQYYWMTTLAGSTYPLSFRVPICAIVDCPVNENIEFCMNVGQSSVAGANSGRAILAGQWEGMALCIS